MNESPETMGKKGRDGVADYFAILGVGEKLVWKHAQKSRTSDYHSSSSKASENESEEEDEGSMMERFYREIVELAIVTKFSSSDSNHHETTSSRRIPPNPSFATDDSASISSSQANNATVASTTRFSQIVTSPSHSDATTAYHTLADSSLPTTTFEARSEHLDGLTIIRQTFPASRGSTTTADSSMSTTADDSMTRSVMSDADLTWKKFQVFDANLDPIAGLRAELSSLTALPHDPTAYDGASSSLNGLRRKVGSTLRNQLLGMERRRDRRVNNNNNNNSSCIRGSSKFYLAFRRRAPDESYRPAIADVSLHYIRLHKSTISLRSSFPLDAYEEAKMKQRSFTKQGSSMAARVADLSRMKYMEKYSTKFESFPGGAPELWFRENSIVVPLAEVVPTPSGYDSWVVPEEFRYVRQPDLDARERKPMRMTYIVPHRGPEVADDATASSTGTSGIGVEAFVDGNSVLSANSPTGAADSSFRVREHGLSPRTSEVSLSIPDAHEPGMWNREVYRPRLLAGTTLSPTDLEMLEDYVFIPVVAIRRQRVGDEERYHEDPGVVDIAVMFSDQDGNAVLPLDDPDHNADGDDDDDGFSLLSKSPWVAPKANHTKQSIADLNRFNKGGPTILVRRNVPVGFADAAFATRVLDRFPFRNYKGLPLPAEELPMFCYPTGCRLHRARFSDAALPQYYGFVLKNERGDSIYVSCVSFMEKLTTNKVEQLAIMSEKRARTSIPHMLFCEKRRAHRQRVGGNSSQSRAESLESELQYRSLSDTLSADSGDATFLLTGFEEMTTFENKTICLISRYPFWTAFRRFLSHLHILSGSSTDIPLERCISHLLLTVPLPKAGGPNIIVPLPALNGPMILSRPADKDLPMVDLPFHRLLACLDVSTMITIVLGFLVLERKVIVMSTRPALVLDVCELLRSLMFPFDLCAPYVPRLTEPFMSCLDFPGAIFVGIHDDGSNDGLAAIVRKAPPEESAIVDLDTGRIDCSGDRFNSLQQSWGIIPAGPRSALVAEIDCLCRDAGIVPGQEPLDSQIDPAFEASVPSSLVEYFDDPGHRIREPLDDRAVRDSFLRFFCAVLGGYERFLVVPDVDFLISGNEWFDTEGFLATASQEKAPYLRSLVSTQLFQSFIQRRTEASDVRCLLFDECLNEFHSSPVAYGRLGGDVETVTSNETGQPHMIYSLLVDQCATEPSMQISDEQMGPFFERRSAKESKVWDSDTDSSACQGIKASQSFLDLSMQNEHSAKYSESHLNGSGDFVTAPSKKDLPEGQRFVYCIDGTPCFPHQLIPDLFVPREPESWLVELSTTPSPTLSRSDREVEEANRRRRMATSYRGLHNQRRCLWQLPKLMGSHFLGSWLLCIPAQVSQPHLSQDQQAKYLLRALGALRLLRNKQRIVPDEAAYRALMVACGRSKSDRRVELVKLFGLLRSDGIFPSAVTLGQYTRALAEGYSKRSTGLPDEDFLGGVEVTESASRGNRVGIGRNGPSDVEALNSLDSNVVNLEESGRRWRQRYSIDNEALHPPVVGESAADDSVSVGTKEQTQEANGRQRKRGHNRSWLPVVFSSSFVPRSATEEINLPQGIDIDSIRLVALWSRTRSCDSCSYIPLEEEVQSGWDVVGGENEIPGAICCPRCGSLLIPMIGCREVSLTEAMSSSFYDSSQSASRELSPDFKAFDGLPPQITPFIDPPHGAEGKTSYVTYISPASLRVALERQVEKGEGALERDSLREQDPELFYNFWWYCARFSLPLPLPVDLTKQPKHYLAFAAWDRSVAERACRTAARALCFLFNLNQEKQQGSKDEWPQDHAVSSSDSFDEYPLLSRFNLQALCQADWDHPDLSAILVGLVEACEGKRDFRPVVETVLRCNKKRREAYGSVDSGSDVNSSFVLQESSVVNALTPSSELDCYRTILYLAKYQCTSAFHVFFPTIAKPCKGYHFWCAIGTPLPIFDRLLREAMKRARTKDRYTPIQEATDVALGFRCVFGHLI